MSDGLYMRAFIPNKKKKKILMKSDTYDTIDWLVKIHKKIMVMLGCGNLYPVLLDLFIITPLKAVSPQACISDFF
jgi:hypothetical protein